MEDKEITEQKKDIRCLNCSYWEVWGVHVNGMCKCRVGMMLTKPTDGCGFAKKRGTP